MRITETRGSSWRGRRPGTRHWHSRSVSMGFGWWLLGGAAWYGLVLPFIAVPLWLVIQLYLYAVLAAVAIGLWAGYSARLGVLLPFHVDHHRHGPFWWPVWREAPL